MYVSVTPSGVATFFLKYTNRNTHERGSVMIGLARIEAMALKARIGRGEDVAQTARQAKQLQAKLSGVTVDQVIDERIEWMKTLVKKADGEMRPRLETWSNVASHLNRFIRPRLGKKVASDVTKHDIATLSNDIVAGRLGVPSTANARHMRRAASAMFSWAAEAGRDYVTASPCINLPPLDEEHPRTRVLSEDEIRTLWRGLDRTDLPVERKVCLAIRFALVSMLRSTELLHMHRDELNNDDIGPVADIPAKRVKKRRIINQPLSDLAMEIITEAMGNLRLCLRGPLRRCAAGSQRHGHCVARTKGKGEGQAGGQVRGPMPAARHRAVHAARSEENSSDHRWQVVLGCRDRAVPSTSPARMPMASRCLRSQAATTTTRNARTCRTSAACWIAEPLSCGGSSENLPKCTTLTPQCGGLPDTKGLATKGPSGFTDWLLPFNEERHGDTRQMIFRTRHQKEAVDVVMLDTSGRQNARNSSLHGGYTSLFDRSLSWQVCSGETGGQMSLHVRLWHAITKL